MVHWWCPFKTSPSQIQVESTGGFSKAELTTPWNPGCNQFQPPRLLLPPGYTTARLPYLGAGHPPELWATLKTLQPTTDSHIYPQTLITMIIDYDTNTKHLKIDWATLCILEGHQGQWCTTPHTLCHIYNLHQDHIMYLNVKHQTRYSTWLGQYIQDIFYNNVMPAYQHTTYWLHNVSCWSNLLSTDAS